MEPQWSPAGDGMVLPSRVGIMLYSPTGRPMMSLASELLQGVVPRVSVHQAHGMLAACSGRGYVHVFR
jgi:hypothetical protein